MTLLTRDIGRIGPKEVVRYYIEKEKGARGAHQDRLRKVLKQHRFADGPDRIYEGNWYLDDGRVFEMPSRPVDFNMSAELSKFGDVEFLVKVDGATNKVEVMDKDGKVLYTVRGRSMGKPYELVGGGEEAQFDSLNDVLRILDDALLRGRKPNFHLAMGKRGGMGRKGRKF